MSLKNLRKNKLFVALVIDDDLYSGGAYQQSLSAIKRFNNLKLEFIEIIYFNTKKSFNSNDIDSTYINLTLYKKFFLNLRSKIRNKRLIQVIKYFKKYNDFEKYFIIRDIDLIYFLSPNHLALYLENINYITTVWDLCHLEQLEFPEVRIDREFERRENKYQQILPKATAIVVDSEIGRQNLIFYYRINFDRIIVQNFDVPSQNVNINTIESEIYLSTIGLVKRQYIFYPAQFWPHKNHKYIIESIYFLEYIYGIKLTIVFSGRDKGNLSTVISMLENYNLKDRAYFLGFIDNEKLSILYNNSLALFMPTYFGPMNIPPLEAFFHNIPVLYSNIPNLSSMFKPAILEVDINDPCKAAEILFKLITDVNYYEEIVKLGKQKLLDINSTSNDIIWIDFFTKYFNKVRTWRL